MSSHIHTCVLMHAYQPRHTNEYAYIDCIHMYTRTYKHTHACTITCIRIHARIHTRIHTLIYTYMHMQAMFSSLNQAIYAYVAN